jgi:hypothetical protein
MEQRRNNPRTKIIIELGDEDLGRLVRYISAYGSGGFQDWLRRIFSDAVVTLIRHDESSPPTKPENIIEKLLIEIPPEIAMSGGKAIDEYLEKERTKS